MQYCLYSIRLYFHLQSPPQMSSVPLRPRHFILSGAISKCRLLFPSSILDIFQPGGGSSFVVYWTSSHLWGGSSFGVISFGLFIFSVEFSRQEYWSQLPFLPPVDHVLSEPFTMTHLSWVTWRSFGIMQAPSQQQGCDPWRGMFLDTYGFSFF